MKRRLTLVLLLFLSITLNSSWVSKELKRMTLEKKVAQMVFHVIYPNYYNEDSQYYKHLKHLVKEIGIGGLHIFRTPVYELVYNINKFQKMSSIPLFISADMEAGAGAIVKYEKFFGKDTMTFLPEYSSGGGVRFPPFMALGATRNKELAYKMGEITAFEARSIGIHINFSPVLDVNNNPDNPIINFRSFGEDNVLVGELGVAYINGLQNNGMIATAKHFPGHGDTSQDTHIEMPVLKFDLERLNKIELPPFVKSIKAGVKAVMTAHISLPELTGKKDIPATLSKKIVTDLLRKKLAFKGLIVSDAMVMGSIADKYGDRQAAVEGVKAGLDILLFFKDPVEAIEGIYSAVKNGEISEKRINDSVKRILKAKYELKLHKSRFVDIDKVSKFLSKQKNIKVAEVIARNGVTLLRDKKNTIPLKREKNYYILKISDSYWPKDGWHFKNRLADEINIIEQFYLTKKSNELEIENVYKKIEEGTNVIVPAFIYIGAWKGKSAIPEKIVELLEKLNKKNVNLMVISFANPYIIREIPFVSGYICAYYSSRELEHAAADILLGKLIPKGKLSITIPNLFKYGDGITSLD